MSEVVRHDGDQISGAAMIDVAASLRWSRPDLTADLAGYVAEAARSGDPALWLSGLGWRVHGTAAVGDGRAAVVDALAAVAASELDPAGPAGSRLVVEVASACRDNGDSALARRLAQAVLERAESPETRVDARLVLLRCAGAEGEAAVRTLLDEARAEARALPGPTFAAAVALARAALAREGGRTAEAAEAAAEGLRMLGVADDAATRSVAPHLVDALTAQRLGALLEARRSAEARALAVAVSTREAARATRQAAQLRLVVAQATADDGAAVERALSQAAEYAATVDCPGLEGACRVALGELAEKQGRLDVALAATRAGLEAEHRDAERGRRFREVVSAAADRLVGAGAPTVRRAGGSVGASTGSSGGRAAAAPPVGVSAGAPWSGEKSNGAARTAGTAALGGPPSAIDALLGGLDAGILPAAWSSISDPLAEPRAAERPVAATTSGETGGRRRRAGSGSGEEPQVRAGRRRKDEREAGVGAPAGSDDAMSTGSGYEGGPAASIGTRNDGGQAGPNIGGLEGRDGRRRRAPSIDRVGEDGATEAVTADSAWDALSDGRDGSIDAGHEPLRRAGADDATTNGRPAAPQWARGRGSSGWRALLDGASDAAPSSGEPADKRDGADTEDRPAKPRRRTMATAVPIEEPDPRHTASSGALLGDALISELRARGRWSDVSGFAGDDRGRPGAGASGHEDRAGEAQEGRPDDVTAALPAEGLDGGSEEPVERSASNRERGPNIAQDTAASAAAAGRAGRGAHEGAPDASVSSTSAEIGARGVDRPDGSPARAAGAEPGDDPQGVGPGEGGQPRSRRSANRFAEEGRPGARRVADLLAGAAGGGRAARRRAREAAQEQRPFAQAPTSSAVPESGQAAGTAHAGDPDRTRASRTRPSDGAATLPRAGEPAPSRVREHTGTSSRGTGGMRAGSTPADEPTWSGAAERAVHADGVERRAAEPARAGEWDRADRPTRGESALRADRPVPTEGVTGAGSSTAQRGRAGEPVRARDQAPTAERIEPSAAARAADDWLRSTIAELDRVWGKPDALSSASLPIDRPEPVATAAGESDPDAVGTSVVLDLMDGDRRVGSPDAERVLRGLTERLRRHLPSRGRVRTEDPSTLRIDLPGRNRAETAAWLHPVLRDLAASADVGGELRGARLRGTVHGTDGATGVQLIQDFAPPGTGAERSAGVRSSSGAFRLEDLAVRPGSGGRRHRRAAESAEARGTAEGEDDRGSGAGFGPRGTDPLAPTSGAANGAVAVGRTLGDAGDQAATTGRGGSDGGSAEGASREAGSASGRKSTAPEGASRGRGGVSGTKSTASEGAPEDTDRERDAEAPAGAPTESLGLGDLLAGAMAVYRGL